MPIPRELSHASEVFERVLATLPAGAASFWSLDPAREITDLCDERERLHNGFPSEASHRPPPLEFS